MRLIKFVLLIVLVVVGAVVVFQLGPGTRGVDVIGDRANTVRAELGLADGTPPRPALSAVLVSDWGRLVYVDGAVEACGPACSGETGLVRIISLLPGASRKTVYLRVPAEGDVACDISILEGEARALLGPGEAPACRPDMASLTFWELPFGLARF